MAGSVAAVTNLPAPVDPQGVLQLALWTPTSLVLPETLTYEAWQEVGRVLDRADRSLRWWIGDWWRFGERAYGEMASQEARDGVRDETGLAYQSVANAAWVADRFEYSRRRESLSWSHHLEVAALEPDAQDRFLDQAVAEGWSRNDLRAAIKRSRVLIAAPGSLPPGKYAIVLADPPWRYDFNATEAARAIENQYPTLSQQEIVGLTDAAGRSVTDLAQDDAVLYLWATNPKLTEAIEVLEAWGFRYVTNLAWVKDRIGMGYWARQRHELVLIGVRGEFSPPAEHLRPDSVIEAPRTTHSAKPPALHELIEAAWPDLPKVELFARSGRPGWAVFGNQVEAA